MGMAAIQSTPVLHLRYATPPEWAASALSDRDALLIDHAFCEDKAAATARMLIGAHAKLESSMRALALEEEAHARACRAMLKERGIRSPVRHRDAYVSALRHQGLGRGAGTLLDRLIVSSLIEARSAERFKLLADACRGESFGRFYEDLFAAESRHHTLFFSLASDVFGDAEAGKRLDAMSELEGRIAASRPWGPRIH